MVTRRLARTIVYAVIAVGLLAGATFAAFNPPTAYADSIDEGFNLGTDGAVYEIVVQPDGKILVGGAFTTLGGQPRQEIGRLNADGSLDTGFNPVLVEDAAKEGIYALAVQPDGKILVGGDLTSDGDPFRYVARLNPDGSLDTSFTPEQINSGFSSYVEDLAVQPDGKVLIAGQFEELGGKYRSLARLNPDGSLDTSFDPVMGIGFASDVVLQPDGKIVAAGVFVPPIMRFNPDGSIDASFGTRIAPDPQGTLYAADLALQPDGKILMRCVCSTVDGHPVDRFARLNANGSLDTSFNPELSLSPDKVVDALTLQPDGKILVGDRFILPSTGQPHSNPVRLNADGSLDTSFDHETDGEVNVLTLQPNGMLLVGGKFTTLDGQPRQNIGRLAITMAEPTPVTPMPTLMTPTPTPVTPTPAPALPAPVLIYPDSGAKKLIPVFMWSSVSGAKAYQLQIDNNADFSSPEYTKVTHLRIYCPDLNGSGTFYWRVRARDSAGAWGAWSGSRTVIKY